jgi:hypothetical protein
MIVNMRQLPARRGLALDDFSETGKFTAPAVPSAAKRDDNPALSPDTMRYLGILLREHYDQLASLPVPSKLTEPLCRPEASISPS